MSMSTQAVVSRILTEDIVCLTDARKEIAGLTGKRPDKATIARWVHHGVGGVKLEAVALGRQLFTSKQALTRFIAARTAKALGGAN